MSNRQSDERLGSPLKNLRSDIRRRKRAYARRIAACEYLEVEHLHPDEERVKDWLAIDRVKGKFCLWWHQNVADAALFGYEVPPLMHEIAMLLDRLFPGTCNRYGMSAHPAHVQEQHLLDYLYDRHEILPLAACDLTLAELLDILRTDYKQRRGAKKPETNQRTDAPVPIIPLDKAILEILADAQLTLVQEEIVSRLAERKISTSDKTVGNLLRRLREIGFVYRPLGERKGDAITVTGLQAIGLIARCCDVARLVRVIRHELDLTETAGGGPIMTHELYGGQIRYQIPGKLPTLAEHLPSLKAVQELLKPPSEPDRGCFGF